MFLLYELVEWYCKSRRVFRLEIVILDLIYPIKDLQETLEILLLLQEAFFAEHLLPPKCFFFLCWAANNVNQTK